VGRHAVLGVGAFAGRVYCCSGCARVDEVIAGLPEPARAATIKALAERLGIAPLQGLAARAEAQRVAAAAAAAGTPTPDPDPPDAAQAAAGADGTVVEERFRVEGMHCPSCSWLVERLLESRPGVSAAKVDFLSEVGSVRIDLRRTSRAAALAELERAGYRARALGEAEGRDPERLALRLAVAAIAAMNVMMLAWVHYAELFGMGAGEWKLWLGSLQAVLSVPAVLWAALPIFRRAAGLLRLGAAGMESLLALGMLAALALSCTGFVLPQGDFYFEIPPMIAALALGSRLVERSIRRSGARRIAELVRPRVVRVRRAGPDGAAAGFAALDELRPGERIVVPAGEEVPVDVTVAGEPVTVSEAMLTGEARSLLRRAGACVLSGSRVAEGTLVGEVLRPASASALAQIGERVLAVLGDARVVPRMADRVAAVFVPVIVLGALATFAAHAWWAGLGPWSPGAWLPAVAVLVVACPCAFSIAAAAAVGAVTLRLLREAVLVREPRALDAAAGIDTVVFDKTGTLTAGDMDVRELRWLGHPRPDLLPVVAALEAGAHHPAGVALRRHLAAQGVVPASATEVEEFPGLGVRGRVDGTAFAVGAPASFHDTTAATGPDGGRPFVLFGPVERPVGLFELQDPLRPGARAAVDALRARGLDVRLLSGDDPAVVERCASEVGIERHEGRVLPAEKAERLQALRAAGRRVAYVGDGINDAPALAAADVGIALQHGAGLACEVAGFVTVRDDPAAAARVLEAARRLRRVMAQNYAWAVGYNLVLLPLAALGWLHPAFAALAMFCSSLTVLANSARLLRSGRSV
jgi:Cu+-exporting ATPase